MNNRLLGIVLVGSSLTLLSGCPMTKVDPVPVIWKRFTLDDQDPTPPHAEAGDKFDVVMRDSLWYFDPGQGMSNWKRVGGAGGTDIPMTLMVDGTTQKVWEFDVEITGHAPANDHTAEHKGAFGYSLTVNIPNTGKADAIIDVRGLPQTHAGSAHGVED